MNLDSFGIYGMVINYTLLFIYTGGALILFLYFWWNKRLDMDEEPKLQMMKEKDDE